MGDKRLIDLAKEYCKHFHEGQYRKINGLPYYTHPIAVADILDRYGYSDTTTQCVALLHDTVEDTDVCMGEIKDRFNYEIANGVYVLSKNTISNYIKKHVDVNLPFDIGSLTGDELYKTRLCFARKKVKRVKIADMIHNCSDLIHLENKNGVEKKISDAERFYIPEGREIAPLMVKELEENIQNYHSYMQN